jgi:uncharacterized protein YkwD
LGRESQVSSVLRRIAPVLIVLAFVAAFAPAPVAAQQPSTAEARLLSLVNDARKRVGRVRLLWDTRLGDVTQDRSDYMARTRDFSHASDWVDQVNRKGIKWFYIAETIAKTPPHETAREGARTAMRSWRNSSTHWNLLKDSEFNYIGIGMRRAKDGWRYWTAILIKGPDRTPPKASMVGAKLGTRSGSKRSVTVSWTGRDVRLSVLTSGLRDFRLQRKVGSNSWRTVTDWTTATSRTFTLTVGKTYRFRIRARDKAGNRSTWSAHITVRP